MRWTGSASCPRRCRTRDTRASSPASEALTRMREFCRRWSRTNDEDVQIAQVYLRHRPIADVNELRLVATGITRMNNSEAQVRALDTLARHQLSDRQSLDALTHLFPVAKSIDVQRAVAGILIRADLDMFAKPELVRALRQHRLKSSDGKDLIDVLIRRLQSNLAPAA